MKVLYVKPKRRKKTRVTDYDEVFQRFMDTGEEYVIWGDPIHKNPYVTQIATIGYCKRCGRRIDAKVLYRGNIVYIVRKDSVERFYKEIGF